ncbi:MAG: N-acetyl-D-Glu racemase DgcA [Polyangiaceae bacterium]
MVALRARLERLPLAQTFRIARGAKDEAVVVVAEVSDGAHRGWGESVPYARYGESPEGVLAALEGVAEALAEGLDREALQTTMPPGAARNALDAALWDLEAQRRGEPVFALLGLREPRPTPTCFTLVVDRPGAVEDAARRAAGHGWLKLKLAGDDDDLARLEAARRGAPDTPLVVDANESWDLPRYRRLAPELPRLGVALLEQPFPARADDALTELPHPVPICADESAHHRGDLPALRGRYDAVNVKLDKAGGLTEALAFAQAAEAAGLGVVVGCMVCSSLGTAPAHLLTDGALVVDLDGPLWLRRDRAEGVALRDHRLRPGRLWGYPRP